MLATGSPMSTSQSNSTKVGGEVGEIRSEIDVNSLNKWLDGIEGNRVEGGGIKMPKAPVAVKQFQVVFNTFGKNNCADVYGEVVRTGAIAI